MIFDKGTTLALINITPTIAVSIAALWISYRQSVLDKNKAQRELFEKFNLRFDNINEKLNSIYEGRFIFDQKTQEEIAQDYLNLCSEEYLWHKKGLIDSYIWRNWLNGIKYYLQSQVILNVFIREQQNCPDSYYGFFQSIDIVKLRLSERHI